MTHTGRCRQARPGQAGRSVGFGCCLPQVEEVALGGKRNLPRLQRPQPRSHAEQAALAAAVGPHDQHAAEGRGQEQGGWAFVSAASLSREARQQALIDRHKQMLHCCSASKNTSQTHLRPGTTSKVSSRTRSTPSGELRYTLQVCQGGGAARASSQCRTATGLWLRSQGGYPAGHHGGSLPSPTPTTTPPQLPTPPPCPGLTS